MKITDNDFKTMFCIVAGMFFVGWCITQFRGCMEQCNEIEVRKSQIELQEVLKHGGSIEKTRTIGR